MLSGAWRHVQVNHVHPDGTHKKKPFILNAGTIFNSVEGCKLPRNFNHACTFCESRFHAKKVYSKTKDDT